MRNRRLGWITGPLLMLGLMTIMAIAGVAVAAAALHLGILEDPRALDEWMRAADPWLTAWRLMLWVGLIAAWRLRYRPRLIARLTEDRDGGGAAVAALGRLERFGLLLLVGYELVCLSTSSWWGA